MSSKLNNFPEELRLRAQWCIAGPDEKGTFKAPWRWDMSRRASVTDPSTWTDFATCYAALQKLAPSHGMGYVIVDADPYTFIDMDVKNKDSHPNEPELWTTQEALDRYWKIASTFNSYTEASQSGRGLHVVVRGNIGQGKRRDGVEVYSKERFMICTGNAIINEPVKDGQAWLDVLVKELSSQETSIELGEDPEETTSDTEIVNRLMGAVNGDKFNELCKGDWAAMGFPSQSEADLALISMFTFHSASNEQCRRLFRMTPLGKREKATKNNVYLNRSLKLIRGRQARDAVLETHGAAIAATLMANANTKPEVQNDPVPPVTSAPIPVTYAMRPLEGGLDWPPGNMGYLARHIYRNAPRPVKEVGIISALGFIAGIAGLRYQLPQSGINVYLVLVARSAVGKEAMHSGISKIIHELLSNGYGAISDYVSFADFASGPALVKACAEQQCFVNVSGEWGRKLRRLSQEDNRDGPMQQLRTAMTNLYQKSSMGSIVGGLGYSDKDKSVASVNGVAYSMIGETTPNTFYESLSESMMDDGFLSRFTIIEYNGERPDLNNEHYSPLDAGFMSIIGNILNHACTMQEIGVMRTAEAFNVLDAFDKECTVHINGTLDESVRQMWNRAHLKVLRIAALCAVIDNPNFPEITITHTTWALDLIRRDIAVMGRRMSSGDIGMGDTPRERKLLTIIDDYINNGTPASYNVPGAVHKAGIIPRSVFQIRVQRIASFTTHKMGGTWAMDMALRSLCDSGYLQEMDKVKMIENYGFHGKCFRIVSAPHMASK